jgi:hypothetical protein
MVQHFLGHQKLDILIKSAAYPLIELRAKLNNMPQRR